MWHASPDVGAGYNELYQFDKNGAFIFKYSQFDGEKRVIDISGSWKIIYTNLLELTITQKTVIKNGEFTKNNPSGTTEYVLENGTKKKVKVNPPEQIIYPLGKMEINKQFQYPLMMKIGGKQFWKLGSTSEERLE